LICGVFFLFLSKIWRIKLAFERAVSGSVAEVAGFAVPGPGCMGAEVF
jgi:hypothetical protein